MTIRQKYINSIDIELLLHGLSKRNPFYFRIQMKKDVRSFMALIIEALDIAYQRDSELIIEDSKITPMELNIERGKFLEKLKLSGETEPPRAADIFDLLEMQKIKLNDIDLNKIGQAMDVMDSDELEDRIKRLRGVAKLIG